LISVGLGDAVDVDEDEPELDEATRQFNFWTHQIHIFFVRKFFPAAEKLSNLRQIVEKRRIDDAREKLRREQAADVSK